MAAAAPAALGDAGVREPALVRDLPVEGAVADGPDAPGVAIPGLDPGPLIDGSVIPLGEGAPGMVEGLAGLVGDTAPGAPIGVGAPAAPVAGDAPDGLAAPAPDAPGAGLLGAV